MPIKFKKCAVGYLDVLGFKDLVNSGNLTLINEVAGLLQNAVPNFNNASIGRAPQKAIPTYTQISDCLIISCQLAIKKNKKQYSGLASIVIRTIQIGQFFLRNKRAIRGGIDVDNVWHSQNNIVGPAFQTAYMLESSEAVFPRIILSNSAYKIWLKTNDESMPNTVINYRGHPTVNIFYVTYFPGLKHIGKGIEDELLFFKSFIESEANNQKNRPEVREKWYWLLDFLEFSAQLQGFTL